VERVCTSSPEPAAAAAAARCSSKQQQQQQPEWVLALPMSSMQYPAPSLKDALLYNLHVCLELSTQHRQVLVTVVIELIFTPPAPSTPTSHPCHGCHNS
jgi:hypothetical protein